MASNPSITQYPPGVQLPHEAGPSDGQLPPGEGCYNCNYDFGDLPLSQPYGRYRRESVREERARARRSVGDRVEVEEENLEGVMEVYNRRLIKERDMTIGERVRARRSVDPLLEWNLQQVCHLSFYSH